MNLRKQGIEAYVWCSGCDTTEVRSATGRPYKFDPSPYASRTEAAADLNMTMWVEDNVCSQFEHECAGPTPTTSTTTTTDYLHNYELLYSGLTNNTDQKNSWSCWRTTCGVTSGTNLGKRNPYNDLKLGSVTFSCHDSSFNLQWYATYELASAYRDRTLKDIVYSCVGSSPSNAADAQWNAGKCSPVGSRTDYNCTGGCAATPSRELRIGLGDGSEAADWILFAFQDGTPLILHHHLSWVLEVRTLLAPRAAKMGTYSFLGSHMMQQPLWPRYPQQPHPPNASISALISTSSRMVAG